MNLEIRQEAVEEASSAALYYESKAFGLGLQFLTALKEGYGRILSSLRAWTIVEHGQPPLHRCLLRRFPYGLIYMLKGDKTVVMAVMHLSRKPEYWKDRRGTRGKRE